MGIKKLYRPHQGFWEKIYVVEIVRGLGITITYLFKSWFKKDFMPTYQYPEQKRPVADRFRGRHRLRRREDGSPTCVACYCCQSICPVGAIDIVAEESPDPAVRKRPKEFNINMLRCIYCGMCVEACPVDAIYHTKDYEFANTTREKMQFALADLLDPLPAQEMAKKEDKK